MLPDERTTHNHELALPGEAEGLIVAPGRALARPLVGFLRDQGLTVRTAEDADAAFEEALLHPPDIVLVDEEIPDGGIDLCRRLKDNLRTHFVPVIVCGLDDLRSFRLRAITAGRTRCSCRPWTFRNGGPGSGLCCGRARSTAASSAASAPRRARSWSGAPGCRTSCTT